MKSSKIIIFVFYVMHALSTHCSNAVFNKSGVEFCANMFLNCTMNATGLNSSCFNPLESCISQHGYMNIIKPLECFLAESAWSNLYISIGFSGGIFLFSNILWPALLKGAAKCITKLAKVDEAEHPCLSQVGNFFLFFTDADGDRTVTATELITPQTIFTFASALLPIYPLIDANNAQARCCYELSLYPK